MLAALSVRDSYVNLTGSASSACGLVTRVVPQEQPASSYGEGTLVCPAKGEFSRAGLALSRHATMRPGNPSR
jgi:hypothetical protein